MLVKNIIGSTGCEQPTGFSSLRHWWAVKKDRVAEEKAGTIPCSKCGKNIGENGDGGHVCNVGVPSDEFCYIVPLCYDCNNNPETKPFEVEDGVLLRIPLQEGFEDEDEEEGVCICRNGGTCHIEEFLEEIRRQQRRR